MRLLAEPYEFSSNERWTLGVLLGALLLLIAAEVAPGGGALLPSCPSYSLAELNCPGCGLTRATRALLHLDGGRALAHNPLVLWVVPFASYLVLTALVGVASGRRLLSDWPPVLVRGVQASFAITWFALGALRLASWLWPACNPGGIGLPPPL